MSRAISFNRGRGKSWVHPPDALLKGQVLYNVKFLGCVEVDQPKGSEMVRDAIRKMKFNRQIKKAEGEKLKKVELSISIDVIKIQDPKYKTVLYQYPLHYVSYCADDKSDKRMFTFIAKQKDSSKHHCFVFDSEKSAEEVTLTVGQAFDLAYKRFLETSNRDGDPKKQLLVFQKKIQELTSENSHLKEKVVYLETLLASVKPEKKPDNTWNLMETKLLGSIDSSASVNGSGPKPVSNGAHMAVTSPTASENSLPILAPPPPIPNRSFSSIASPDAKASQDADLFSARNFASPVTSPTVGGGRAPVVSDVFGMEMFNPSTTYPSFDLDQLQGMDKEQLDLEANFSRGLSFGTEDFSLDDLDPLKKP